MVCSACTGPVVVGGQFLEEEADDACVCSNVRITLSKMHFNYFCLWVYSVYGREWGL